MNDIPTFAGPCNSTTANPLREFVGSQSPAGSGHRTGATVAGSQLVQGLNPSRSPLRPEQRGAITLWHRRAPITLPKVRFLEGEGSDR
jgi:hypothetical protein